MSASADLVDAPRLRGPRLGALVLAVLPLAGCEGPASAPPPPEGGSTMSLHLTSTAFEPGQPIPTRYTCDGEDVSPPLDWSEGPAGTTGYALIMDDPDAPGGTWLHWTAWNISGTHLDEGAGRPGATPELRHGLNSWGRPGYGGPCPPPPTGTHRYVFRVHAMDGPLDLRDGSTQDDLLRAMEGHVLATGELVGTYRRGG